MGKICGSTISSVLRRVETTGWLLKNTIEQELQRYIGTRDTVRQGSEKMKYTLLLWKSLLTTAT